MNCQGELLAGPPPDPLPERGDLAAVHNGAPQAGQVLESPQPLHSQNRKYRSSNPLVFPVIDRTATGERAALAIALQKISERRGVIEQLPQIQQQSQLQRQFQLQ